MLPGGLAELKQRARTEGEVFVPVLERDDLRLGLIIAERKERAGICVEALLRLLPAGSSVDLPALRTEVERLGRWVELGYRLQHFDGEWVVAIKRSDDDDVQTELEELLRTVGSRI